MTHPSASAPPSWWQEFWSENDLCLYGEAAVEAANLDGWPVFPAFTTDRPRVPVLIELGENWIIEQMQVPYQRFIQDFDFQQEVRRACAAMVMADIGLHMKPYVHSSSLLHGSVYGNPIEYPDYSTPWLRPIIHSPQDIKPLIAPHGENRSGPGWPGAVVRFLPQGAELSLPDAHSARSNLRAWPCYHTELPVRHQQLHALSLRCA